MVYRAVGPLSVVGGRHLEDYAAAAFALASAAGGGSPEIARRVEGQRTAGTSAAFRIGEIVEHGFLPTFSRGRQLVDRAAARTLATAIAAALQRGPVEIAGLVQDQAAIDQFAVVGG